MMMTPEAQILRWENLDQVYADLKGSIHQAAQQGLPAHEVEMAVWQEVLRLGHGLLDWFFALHGNGDMGETITLPGGASYQRLPELHERRYVSIFGEFKLPRTVYGSRKGQKIEFVPLDNRLQLPKSDFSYVLQDWDQGFCCEQAFGQSAQQIQRILGMKQPVDSLERMNVHMAEYVEDFRDEHAQATPEEEGELFVLSADGKGIVMRRGEPASRGHRTKGEKASQKRMAIVGAAYSVDRYVRTPEQIVAALFGDEPRCSAGRPQPKHKHVWASLPEMDARGNIVTAAVDIVYPWLLNELVERNRDRSKEVVYLHDGQESLWEACDRHLPKKNSTCILDLLHVTPRLWKAAHVFHKEKSREAEQFVRGRVLKVLQGKSDLVVRGLREMATKRKLPAAKRKTIARVCAYLENNRERMHYDEYLAKGYPIASGVIEGACRHLVKDRMERAGMHWTRPGAQAMLDVRSIWISDRWDAYQFYRRERELNTLYPERQLVEGTNTNFKLAI